MTKSFVFGFFILFVLLNRFSESARASDRRIQPYSENARYWQYEGKPVLLIGGSDDDNLFQWPERELIAQLDLLVRAGGNYLRNTMSWRDEGNVWPFARTGNAYDLNRWNEAFWDRLRKFLEETAEREIFVQIEVWAFHDFFSSYGNWAQNPWNPENNVNYSMENTRLKNRYDRASSAHHDFFFTPPELNNDREVLHYQQKFVDRLLEETLKHDHVLYCVTNEIHTQFSSEWSAYWIGYIQTQAGKAGQRVETTEMFWTPDLKGDQHLPSLEQPEVYTYFEASQNSAIRSGQENWDNLQAIHRTLGLQPRPINHTKIYGADTGPGWAGLDRDAEERFWRNIIGGSASSRFHRPPTGLGLGEKAQSHLKSLRMLAGEHDFFRSVPDSDHGRLREREENEAYLTYVSGQAYAVYFPGGGRVDVDLRTVKETMTIRWLDIAASRWRSTDRVTGGGWITLESPGGGQWVALLQTISSSE